MSSCCNILPSRFICSEVGAVDTAVIACDFGLARRKLSTPELWLSAGVFGLLDLLVPADVVVVVGGLKERMFRASRWSWTADERLI